MSYLEIKHGHLRGFLGSKHVIFGHFGSKKANFGPFQSFSALFLTFLQSHHVAWVVVGSLFQ